MRIPPNAAPNTDSPLRIRRETKGIPRHVLAARAGVSLTAVQLAERAGYVSQRTLGLLATALGCTVAEITPRGRA
jgi:transcriptional regulator with XRE-family HTH domain